MSKPFALLCPGQGAQHPQMFDLARSDPATAALLQEINARQSIGITVDEAFATSDRMFDNVIAQPLVVAATLANWHAIRDAIPQPTVIAGYSIGEISAHAVSGGLDIFSAIQLAKERALAMQGCVQEDAPHCMLAVKGIPIRQIVEFVRQHRVYLAIVTSESSCIIAGCRADIYSSLPALQQLGGRAMYVSELPVKVASHTPMMAAASPAIEKLLMQTSFNARATAVIAGINGELVHTNDQVRSSLLTQLTRPIQWSECMDSCNEAGIRFALELGPGAALSAMLQARHPHIVCRSVADFRTISGVIEWVLRQSHT